jgi:Zn-dependent metalloprotease
MRPLPIAVPLLFSVFGLQAIGCALPADDAPAAAESVAASGASVAFAAAEAARELTAGYVHVERHRIITAGHVRPEIQRLQRAYDGVPMLGGAKLVMLDGRWSLRSRRELREPQPVNGAAVIALERAAALAGAADALVAGKLTGRLVHDPVYEQLAKVPDVRNAEDVELVISDYRLAWELTTAPIGSQTFVDAYTGAIIRAQSPVHEVAVQAKGFRYGANVPLDLVPVSTSYYLRDARRFSRYAADGTPFNGLGVLTGIVADTDVPLPYTILASAATWQVDAHFALSQAWDLYKTAFGRVGLKGVAGPGNDPVIAWDPSGNPSASMTWPGGLIQVHGSNPTRFATLEIIGHEYAHAVYFNDTDAQCGHNGECGGISEAHADLIGELVQARGLQVLATPKQKGIGIVPIQSWVMGDESVVMRNLCRQSVDGKSKDVWEPGLGALDEHFTAGVVNRMTCLLARGVSKLSTNPAAAPADPLLTSSYVPDGFAGLGTEPAARIWVGALAFLAQALEPYAFLDLREAMLSSATALYGKFTAEYKAVEDAFAAVRVGRPADRAPPTVTLPATTIAAGKPFTVNATDAHGVSSVICALDGVPLVPNGVQATPDGTAWICVAPAAAPGLHTLTVTATDSELNQGKTEIAVIVDDAGPTTKIHDITPVTPLNRLRKTYKVTATDPVGIEKITLSVDGVPHGEQVDLQVEVDLGDLNGPGVYVDGVPYDSVTVATATFTVDYLAGGFHWLRAEAIDHLGNARRVDDHLWVDTSPPDITAITVTELTSNVSGHCLIDVCAYDFRGRIAAYRVQIDPPTGPFATFSIHGSTETCLRFVRILPLGDHIAEAQLEDEWGNRGTRTHAFTVNGIPPTITGIAVEVVDDGNGAGGTVAGVEVHPTYTAPVNHEVVRADLEICGATCSMVDTELAPGATTTVLQAGNFVRGASYVARVTVTDDQGLTAQREQAFTVPSSPPPPPPPPADVVFNEVEPNNSFAGANSVATSFNVIRATQPAGPINEDDFFKIAVPAGKQICIAAAKTTSSSCPAYIRLWDRNPTEGPALFLPLPVIRASRAEITSSDFLCDDTSTGFVWVERGIDTAVASCATAYGYDIVFKYQ